MNPSTDFQADFQADLQNCELMANTHAEKIKKLRQLLDKKQRLQKSKLLVEGINAVEQVIKLPKSVFEVIVDIDQKDHQRVSKVILETRKNNIILKFATREVLDKITEDAAGILAVASTRCEIPECNSGGPIVICNNVRDPGNAGTIVRASVAFGASKVIFASDSVDHWNPKLIRASVGAAFQIPIMSTPDLRSAIEYATNLGYTTVCADLYGTKTTPALKLFDDGENYGDGNNDKHKKTVFEAIKSNQKIAWIFGNEAQGLTSQEVDLCDYACYIPMSEQIESLNLAGSVHICLAYTKQKRGR